ncbi:hypothetical protein J4481_01400, partial [Candidatus Pacearchaeota archaeon]|nr:hypothetical protein [Candidatus Pacearchaeota archaeon]
FLLGVAAILFVFGSVLTFDVSLDNSIKLAVLTSGIYVLVILLLLNPVKIKEINESTIEHVGVPIQIIETIEKPVIKEIFRDVVRTVEKPIIQKVFVEKPKAPVKHRMTYKYIGTSESQTYHKHSCRFSKLIKKKYQVKENDKKYFKLRGYKRCKYCKP